MKNTLLWIFVAIITMYSVYVIIILPIMNNNKMQKQKENLENFQKDLKVSTNVLTASGIYGTIVDINKNVISLEIAPKVIVKIDKFAIIGVTKKNNSSI